MSNDDWTLQVSCKFGPNQQHLLNVRATDAQSLRINLDEVAGGEVITSLTHLGAVLEAGVALTPVTSAAAPAPAYQPPQQQWAPEPPQAPPAPGAGMTPAPPCPHGTRQFKQGVGAKGPWSAYFCPAPKGTPGQCEPQWLGR